SLPVPRTTTPRRCAELFRSRGAGRVARSGRAAAGQRGAETCVGDGAVPRRAPAVVRCPGDAIPRDPPAAGPGLRGLRRGSGISRLYRLRAVLLGRLKRTNPAGGFVPRRLLGDNRTSPQ